MKQTIERVVDFWGQKYKQTISGFVILAVIGTVGGVYWYNFRPVHVEVTHLPVVACDVLTESVAKQLLGDKVIKNKSNKSAIGGNIAESQCSYSDANAQAMRVAAVAIRSGLNDEGVKQTKDSFTIRKNQVQSKQAIGSLGDDAFFDKETGQMNVLDGYSWYIVSFGDGNNPATNTIDDSTKMVKLILKK